MSATSYLLLLALLPLSMANISFGRCPRPAKVQNFDLNRYLGIWYENYRDSSIPFESGDCVMAQYSLREDGKVKVVNSGVHDGERTKREGEAYCTDNEGQCYVRFSPKAPYGDYEVIDTDYENYSIVYSCQDYLMFHVKYGWVLSRDTEFDGEKLLDTLVEKGKFKKSTFRKTSQKDCPEF